MLAVKRGYKPCDADLDQLNIGFKFVMENDVKPALLARYDVVPDFIKQFHPVILHKSRRLVSIQTSAMW